MKFSAIEYIIIIPSDVFSALLFFLNECKMRKQYECEAENVNKNCRSFSTMKMYREISDFLKNPSNFL